MTQGAQNNPTFQEKVLPASRSAAGASRGLRRHRRLPGVQAAAYHTGQMFVIDGGYTIF
jgi:hypothetical protein